MAPINVERCRTAMKNLAVKGIPRNSLIAVAITAIQENGSTAMASEFFGIKNYASFGDQRCDCRYGMGPSHGSIVFSIGRTRGDGSVNKALLGPDEVYLLECIRDFGGKEFEAGYGGSRRIHRWNLTDCINEMDLHYREFRKLKDEIDAAVVTSHEDAEIPE